MTGHAAVLSLDRSIDHTIMHLCMRPMVGELSPALSMHTSSTTDRPLAILGTAFGLAGALMFLGWSVMALPDRLDLIFHVLFGPLVMAGFLGLEVALRRPGAWNGTLLAIARAWGTAAALLFTAMTLVQSSGVVLLNHRIADAPENAIGVWRAILAGVATVQLGLDVAWDVYVLLGTLLFAGVLCTRPSNARLLGALGVVIASVTLVLNLLTFPIPPAEAGWFDGGPFVGGWFLVVSVWVLIDLFRSRRLHVSSSAEADATTPLH